MPIEPPLAASVGVADVLTALFLVLLAAKGVGMVPRGEVGIIVAGIGRTTGVIDDELFAVIVGMSILTTLAVPPIMRRLVSRPEPAVPS